MEETQSFRLYGTADTVEITHNHVDGQNIIYWEDIEQVFPGVNLVMNGSVAIDILGASHRIRTVPPYIIHRPGVVLDVVLFSAADPVHGDSPLASSGLAPASCRAGTSASPPANRPASLPSDDPTNAPADASSTIPPAILPPDTPTDAPNDAPASPPTNPHVIAPTNQADACPPGAIMDVLLANPSSSSLAKGFGKSSPPVPPAESVSSPPMAAETSADHSPTESCQGFQSAVIHRLEASHDPGALNQQIITRKVLDLSEEMTARLILIQSRTEAILNRQLELTEYPIPRLFIVLPEEMTKYDPGSWFRTKFRLHFICECGEHTEPSNSNVPHHLHLAKHEGYLIREPTVFFKKYGPFLLLTLELIKFETSVAGHVEPTLASLEVVELVDTVQQRVKLMAKINYSLECIDSELAKIQASPPGDFIDTEPRAAMTYQDMANYLSNVEGLEGVESRQLESYLKTSEEENVPGNLYPMTTSNGHVRWVCRHHYRAGYQEMHAQKLRDMVKLAQGEFDEQLGRITITLTSSFAAAKFYNAISNVKGVLELTVDLSWECTRSDLEVLEDMLKKSGVSILRLHLRQFRTSLVSRLLSTSAQGEVLIRIINLPRMKIIRIVLPKEFKLFNFQPKIPPHLCKLSLELVTGWIGGKEFGRLAEALKTNSTLITLDLRGNSIRHIGAQALAEALKINSTLTTLDLRDNSIGDNGAQALAEALKINSTLITLDLQNNSIWFKGLLAFSEALKTYSTLTTLDLRGNLIKDKIAQALSDALKTNSTLATLDLQNNSIGDNGAQALSEALKINSTLTTLDLQNNSIRDDGAQALAEVLKFNSTLITLDLQTNSIRDYGVQTLSEALKTNSTLTTLNLWGNAFGNNGAMALSEALKTNSTLTALNLGYNSIGYDGAWALSTALQNSTLITLNLQGNSMGFSLVQGLAEALKMNSTLTTLDLQDNSIGDDGAKALSVALKKNSTLTTLNLRGNSIGEKGAQALYQVSQKTRCHILR